MSDIRRDEEQKRFSEEADSLWMITFAPLIWAVHFLLCYVATAVVCAHATTLERPLDDLRLGIGVLTSLALSAILAIAWRAWSQWNYLDDYDYVHDAGTGEHRHEFLGHAAFLLAIVAFIGVSYTALPALFIETCR